MQAIVFITVLHFASTAQDRALNIETIQVPAVSCSQTENDMREYYKNERYSRIINLKCIQVGE